MLYDWIRLTGEFITVKETDKNCTSESRATAVTIKLYTSELLTSLISPEGYPTRKELTLWQ